MKNYKVERLEKGETIVSREPGNSMTPLIYSKEPIILEPVQDWLVFKKGDVAYVKIKGRFYTHLVHGIDKDKGLLIGNNHGHVQGWTKKVYAKGHIIPNEYKDKAEEYLEIFKNNRQ